MIRKAGKKRMGGEIGEHSMPDNREKEHRANINDNDFF